MKIVCIVMCVFIRVKLDFFPPLPIKGKGNKVRKRNTEFFSSFSEAHVLLFLLSCQS